MTEVQGEIALLRAELARRAADEAKAEAKAEAEAEAVEEVKGTGTGTGTGTGKKVAVPPPKKSIAKKSKRAARGVTTQDSKSAMATLMAKYPGMC